MIDPTEAALLRGIAEAHADDTPRLVYADWLEEHGDAPRAEFVRVQCELAAAPAADRRPPLRVRERELLTAHRGAWCESLGVPVEDVSFARGLADRVRVSRWDGGRAIDPAAQPRLAAVTDLDLSGLQLRDADATALAAARLPALRKLDLSDNAITDRGAAALAAAAGFPRLDTLFLFGNQVSPTGRAALAGGRGFRLATLDLGDAAEGYCMSRGQADAARRRFVRTQLLPLVRSYFDKYDRLQSATLCVAQFWNDEAEDAVHGALVVSELPEPTLAGVRYSYDEADARADPNVPNTRIVGQYEETGSVVGIWAAGWDDNGAAIPLWAAFSPEGGSQEHELLDEAYAPAVLFFRHGGYEFLPMCRPHLDGVRPAEGWEE
jgi:uncharacterized protein (TIGR02996 family)